MWQIGFITHCSEGEHLPLEPWDIWVRVLEKTEDLGLYQVVLGIKEAEPCSELDAVGKLE